MPSLEITYNDAEARKMKAKLEAALKGKGQSAPIRRAATVWRDRLHRRTPKRWTGHTKAGWVVQQVASNVFETTNHNKVMLYLEKGTPAHGPTRAKRLFVPLTRKAAMAGPRGVIAANQAARHAAQWANYGSGVTGAKKKKTRFPFIYGVDYVFAKRVRGIKPMWIVRDARVDARRTFKILMREFILSAITKA